MKILRLGSRDTEPEDSVELYELRHAFHSMVLALVIVLAFLKNGYLATLMLLPPAYSWTAMRSRRRGKEDRIMNGLLLMGGAITFVTMAIILTQIFHVGSVYWYLFLSTAYGLVSAYTAVLFFMVLAVMIRLLKSFVL